MPQPRGYLGFAPFPRAANRFIVGLIVRTPAHAKGHPMSRELVDAQAPPLAATPHRHRVLLAEDDPASSLLAMHTLEHFNCEVTAVDNGEAALDAARQGRFDIVFMDYHMPVMDGLLSTQAIRAWERAALAKPVAIVAMTASAMPEERQACLDAGMDDVLIKPFPLRELERLLQRWSGNR